MFMTGVLCTICGAQVYFTMISPCKGILFIFKGLIEGEIIITTAGSDTGYEFDDFTKWDSSGRQNISAIEMTCAASGIFGTIKVSYGTAAGVQRGYGDHPEDKAYTLGQDEVIVGVNAWEGTSAYLYGLRIITNKQTFEGCGSRSGTMLSFRYRQLLYISGKYGWYLDKLNFHWYDGKKKKQIFNR